MIAYHTLRADMRTGSGSSREKPWSIGERRKIRGTIELCKRGFHSCPTPFDTLPYIQGPVLCRVDVTEPEKPEDNDGTKQVSRERELLAYVNVETELRLFICDCAERALLGERDHGREPDERSWKAVTISRLFAQGKATVEELVAAEEAAWAVGAATWATWAAWAAARAAARAAGAAARAAGAAAREAEGLWQRQRFDELVTSKLEAVTA